jgi:hypothetical protein
MSHRSETEEALAALLKWADAHVCHHDETKRGGTIWTICCDCGKRWADDEGGFKPFEEPWEFVRARRALGIPA